MSPSYLHHIYDENIKRQNAKRYLSYRSSEKFRTREEQIQLKAELKRASEVIRKAEALRQSKIAKSIQDEENRKAIELDPYLKRYSDFVRKEDFLEAYSSGNIARVTGRSSARTIDSPIFPVKPKVVEEGPWPSRFRAIDDISAFCDRIHIMCYSPLRSPSVEHNRLSTIIVPFSIETIHRISQWDYAVEPFDPRLNGLFRGQNVDARYEQIYKIGTKMDTFRYSPEQARAELLDPDSEFLLSILKSGGFKFPDETSLWKRWGSIFRSEQTLQSALSKRRTGAVLSPEEIERLTADFKLRNKDSSINPMGPRCPWCVKNARAICPHSENNPPPEGNLVATIIGDEDLILPHK
jgi:hypothetical protein